MNTKSYLSNGYNNILFANEINQIFNMTNLESTFDNKMIFELFYYLCIILHLFMQNYHIYRCEIHIYNFTLFFFSAIFLSKRLWFRIWIKFKMKHPVENGKRKALLGSCIILVSLNFLYCGLKTFYYHSIGSTFCLFYPYIFSQL